MGVARPIFFYIQSKMGDEIASPLYIKRFSGSEIPVTIFSECQDFFCFNKVCSHLWAQQKSYQTKQNAENVVFLKLEKFFADILTTI